MPDSFQFLATSDLGRWATLAICTLLLLGTILANIWVRVPGPLTSAERRAVSGYGRMASWLPLAVCVFTCGVGIWVVATPRQEEALVLVSRARLEQVSWDGVNIEPAVATGLAEDKPCDPERGPQLLDVGRLVDQRLARLDPNGQWARPDPHAREEARKVLRLELPAVDMMPLHQLQQASLGIAGDPSTGAQLRSWLVESIELSVVLLQARTRHVTRIYVAPARSDDVSPWRILGAVLQDAGVEVCLVDPLPDRATHHLEVSAVASPQFSSKGRLTFWAVIDGKVPPEEGMVEVGIQGSSGTTPVRLRVPPDEDAPDATSRIRRVCVGTGCEGPGVVTAVDAAAALSAIERSRAGQLRATLLASKTARGQGARAVIEEESALRRAPRLVLGTEASSAEPFWARMLDDATAPFAVERRTLQAELIASNLYLPSLTATEGERRVAYVEQSNGLVAFGGSPSAAAWALQHTSASLQPSPGRRRTRVVTDRTGVTTLFSWTSLPVLTRSLDAPVLPAGGASVVVGMFPAERTEKPRREASAGLLMSGSVPGMATGGRYVVLAFNPGAHEQLLQTDPFQGLCFLRTVAWAADLASSEKEPMTLRARERPPEFHTATPLLTAADIGELSSRGLRPWDAALILLVGLWCALALAPSPRSVIPSK